MEITNPISTLAELERSDVFCFESFVRETTGRARFFARMLSAGDDALADDLVQRAYLAGLRNVNKHPCNQLSWSWLRTVLLNERRKRYRWAMVRERALPFLRTHTRTEVGKSEQDIPLKEKLKLALQALSQKQREVFILVYFEQMTLKEAAETLSIAEGTAKSHLHRALVQLRTDLSEVWKAIQK